jgi:hypothetical protein
MSENLRNRQTKAQMIKQTNQTKLHGAALLEKLTVPDLVKKFPTLYGNQIFITMFTTAHQLSLSRARQIQSMTFQLISSTTLILSSHLPQVFPSTFPTTTPYAFLLHHACCMLCPAILHNFISLILYCGEYKSLSLSLCNVTPACHSPSL